MRQQEDSTKPRRRGASLAARGGTCDDEDTAVLTAMGFSNSQIRDALVATDGCLQSAIELLLA